MIQESITNSIQRSGAFKESKAQIVASSEIMEILRKDIYTDAILAMVREITMNAIDAHVMAGESDKPI